MKIRLTEYNEHWKAMYEQEVVLLQPVFGSNIIRFEHFGSTSIPGMKAKPVIDMMCIVEEIEKVDSYNRQMESLGYEAAGEWGIKGRRLFRKGGEERTHHLHIYEKGNPHIDRHVIFRDYLLAHPEEANAYSRYKEGLAAKYDSTREYSTAKKGFVSAMEQRALAWFRKRGSKKMDHMTALEQYLEATNTHQFGNVERLLHPNAVYWFSDRTCTNLEDIRAYFENAWYVIQDEKYAAQDVQWLAVDENTATCIYRYYYEGDCNGKFVSGSGRATNVFKKDREGKWKLIHEHLSNGSM